MVCLHICFTCIASPFYWVYWTISLCCRTVFPIILLALHSPGPQMLLLGIRQSLRTNIAGKVEVLAQEEELMETAASSSANGNAMEKLRGWMYLPWETQPTQSRHNFCVKPKCTSFHRSLGIYALALLIFPPRKCFEYLLCLLLGLYWFQIPCKLQQPNRQAPGRLFQQHQDKTSPAEIRAGR